MQWPQRRRRGRAVVLADAMGLELEHVRRLVHKLPLVPDSKGATLPQTTMAPDFEPPDDRTLEERLLKHKVTARNSTRVPKLREVGVSIREFHLFDMDKLCLFYQRDLIRYTEVHERYGEPLCSGSVGWCGINCSSPRCGLSHYFAGKFK